MTLASFVAGGKGTSNKELLLLKRRLGGQVGTLSVGNERMREVLKLADNVYVAADKAPRGIQTALSLDQADLHVVKSNADIQYFTERFRAFKGAQDGEAKRV